MKEEIQKYKNIYLAILIGIIFLGILLLFLYVGYLIGMEITTIKFNENMSNIESCLSFYSP